MLVESGIVVSVPLGGGNLEGEVVAGGGLLCFFASGGCCATTAGASERIAKAINKNHDLQAYVRNHVEMRDPREVARLIARIAQDPYPNLRYPIGNNARMFKLLTSILSWKQWERMVQKQLGL